MATNTVGYTPVRNIGPTSGRISSRSYSRQYNTTSDETLADQIAMALGGGLTVLGVIVLGMVVLLGFAIYAVVTQQHLGE